MYGIDRTFIYHLSLQMRTVEFGWFTCKSTNPAWTLWIEGCSLTLAVMWVIYVCTPIRIWRHGFPWMWYSTCAEVPIVEKVRTSLRSLGGPDSYGPRAVSCNGGHYTCISSWFMVELHVRFEKMLLIPYCTCGLKYVTLKFMKPVVGHALDSTIDTYI